MLALLVVNPQATATTPGGRDVLAHALASDVKLEVLETSHRGHAAEAAAQAARDGFDLVVAHGGDGTVNEVVNGLLSATDAQTPMLGVVPGGSANVFAGALGLPRDPVEATHVLLRAIETGHSRTVGLGRVELGATRGAGSPSTRASAGTPRWSRRWIAGAARKPARRCTCAPRSPSTCGSCAAGRS